MLKINKNFRVITDGSEINCTQFLQDVDHYLSVHNLEQNATLLATHSYKFLVEFYAHLMANKIPILVNPNEKQEIKLPELKDESVAFIIKTSGSSGQPKFAKMSFSNLEKNAIGTNSYLIYNKEDRWLASLPFYHIGGISIFIRSLLYGLLLYIPESPRTEDLCPLLNKVTLISLVYTQLLRITKETSIDIKNIRILLGGGHSDPEYVGSLAQNGYNIFKVYGSTELSSNVTSHKVTGVDDAPFSGRVIAPNIIKVLDDKFNEMPPNEAGQIAVKGPSVFAGYVFNEDNERKFYNGYFLTGDIGSINNEGLLKIVGRQDNMFISGGENIYPEEIEDALRKLGFIKEASVLAISDEVWGEIGVAALVLEDKYKIKADAIKEKLKVLLPAYKIPKKFIFLEKLPKISINKLDRVKLREVVQKYV